MKAQAPKFSQASKNKVNGGTLHRITHYSECNQGEMTFSIFIPETVKRTEEPPAVLFYLSGLTCSDENARTKACIYEHASKYNLAVVFPDTSPRDFHVEGLDTKDWALGAAAGFYIDATTDAYKKNFNMYTYCTKELPTLVDQLFTVDMSRKAITGHSMGGHGALTLHFKNPGMYKSVSAFAPIVNPVRAPIAEKAFKAYLGSVEAGKPHDATHLVATYEGPKPTILIDQGSADDFLHTHLVTDHFFEAVGKAGYPLNYRMQPGYDHSYYFVSTFMKDHIDFHATNLGLVRRA